MVVFVLGHSRIEEQARRVHDAKAYPRGILNWFIDDSLAACILDGESSCTHFSDNGRSTLRGVLPARGSVAYVMDDSPDTWFH